VEKSSLGRHKRGSADPWIIQVLALEGRADPWLKETWR
jgi:hypothetical protein